MESIQMIDSIFTVSIKYVIKQHRTFQLIYMYKSYVHLHIYSIALGLIQ